MKRLIASEPALMARHGMFAFELAILLAGGQGRLAAMIGSTDQKVSHWKLRDLAVPVAWAPRIAAALDHPLITVYSLRPDLADFWNLLRPQLIACARGDGRTDGLTRRDFDNAVSGDATLRAFARLTEREQVSV